MTVPALQEVLQMSSKTLYYQVSKLARVGLLVSTGGDPIVYRAIAKDLRMPPGFQGANYETLAAKSVGAGLRNATRRFARVAQLAPCKPELVDDLLYLSSTLRLTCEKRVAFHAELRRLFSIYSAGEGNAVHVVFVQTPGTDGVDTDASE